MLVHDLTKTTRMRAVQAEYEEHVIETCSILDISKFARCREVQLNADVPALFKGYGPVRHEFSRGCSKV